VRAIGYIRDVSGAGDAAQRTAIAEACKQRGWELADVLVDRGPGATGADRPAFQKARSRLGSAQDGAEALVVASLDRVARSFPDYAALIEVSAAEGWKLVALDTPEVAGESVQATAAAFAQLERRLIRSRTVESFAAARARGVRLGRPVQVSAEIEERILALHRRRRLTARAIARQLETDGVPSPRGGERWHHGTVADIIRRRGGQLTPGRPRKVQRARQRPGS
jgi:DNA invertase Pin-like site-specific DNA recombinase